MLLAGDMLGVGLGAEHVSKVSMHGPLGLAASLGSLDSSVACATTQSEVSQVPHVWST